MSELLAKATKRAQSSAGFFSFSASSKYDDAHELYTAAANQFTIEKNYKQAGDAYAHAADMALLSTDLKDDAASDFWKASKAYKKTHPQRTSLPGPFIAHTLSCRRSSRAHHPALEAKGQL